MARRTLAIVATVATIILSVLASTPVEASSFPYGQCTYWAAEMRPDIGSLVSGNAAQWASQAASAGVRISRNPRPGAIAVFQPWTYGTWALGHVAYVVAAPGNGWVEISEMDWWPWGPGHVDYRWYRDLGGVQYIY